MTESDEVLDKIRELLKEAKWEFEGDLPVWMARHGRVTSKGKVIEYNPLTKVYSTLNGKVGYSPKHFFTGYAKVMFREFQDGSRNLWNDQLFPMPWCLGVTQLPEDPQMLDCLDANTQKKRIWLSYADKGGVWTAYYPAEAKNRLEDRFRIITANYLPKKPEKPIIRMPHGELTQSELEQICSECVFKEVLSPIISK